MLNKFSIGILLSAVLMACGATASAQMLDEAQLRVLLERAHAAGIPQDVALQRIVAFERSNFGSAQVPQQQADPSQEAIFLQQIAQQQARMQGGQPSAARQVGSVMTEEVLRVLSTIYHNQLTRSGLERGYDHRGNYDGYSRDYQLDPKAEMLMNVFEDARNSQYQQRYDGR